MPTIDALEQVVVASDDDILPVSQNGVARRVSRSQLLAGTQAAIALTPGLLGRTSAGLGAVEHVSIGNGLSLSNGVLSGAPRYSPAASPTAESINLKDIIPIVQNGQDRSTSVMAILSIDGIDVSGKIVQSPAGHGRRLSEWLDDAVTVEAFGAIGDGIIDDSGAMTLAIASGRPLRLGPKCYRIDGQWDVQVPAVLIGTPGLTVIQRGSQRGGAWINVSAESFCCFGVTFDAANVDGESWGVLLAPSCVSSTLRDCTFENATGSTLGSGLTIQARDNINNRQSSHTITNCTFRNNACHGLWVQAACAAEISSCQATGNDGFGINLDFNDASFQKIARQSTIVNSRCMGNTRGISIGNYNATNREPPRWGLEHPDATDIIVSGNICAGNSAYGIAVSGSRIQVVNNIVVIEDVLGRASGILCNADLSSIASNIIVGPGQFGLDSGGSRDLSIVSNTITNCSIGINAGGSLRVRIDSNSLVANQRAITIFQTETDGHGENFGIGCKDVWIDGNRIQLEAGNGGIFLMDGPENVQIARNHFTSVIPSTLGHLCWAHSDSATIHQNTWNGSSEVSLGVLVSGTSMQLTVPEVFDTIAVDGQTKIIDRIVGQHQADMVGQISFVRVTNGGSGYTKASIVFSGSGNGAAATAYVRDGSIIGVAIVANGNGYDAISTTAVIVGDGQGATVLPTVGVPLPKNRRLTLRCHNAVRFSQSINQFNWTQTDITIPSGGQIVWEATEGRWQALAFTNVDYVRPTGDGSISIKSIAGDVRLSPAVGSSVRIGSDLEPAGYSTSIGRGSPEGVVVAPPGSDYRNLNGGVGMTLWLKQTGSGSSGWTAIA